MATNKLKILLVDDHSVVRLGIKTLIKSDPELEVVAEAESLAETYKKVEQDKPDIVLLDIKLPDGDGVLGCKKIKSISPDTKIIVLTAYGNESLLQEVIKAGADGYLLKEIDGQRIISAIKQVDAGESAIGPKSTKKLIKLLKQDKKEEGYELTDREKEILDLISTGKTNNEIADELYIAEKTVRNYLTKIFKKLNVDNRTEAAVLWNRQKNIF